jgi:hypothetical protein
MEDFAWKPASPVECIDLSRWWGIWHLIAVVALNRLSWHWELREIKLSELAVRALCR